MNKDAQIRQRLERVRRTIELRPAMAQGTMSVRLEMGDGLKCTTRADQWTTEIDEPVAVGGDDSAPSPGFYGFSALAGCLAMSIKSLAAQSDIRIQSIAIDVKGDYDDRAFFGIGDARPEFQNIRMTIHIRSEAESDEVRSLVEQARQKSTWFNTFAGANSIATDLVTASN